MIRTVEMKEENFTPVFTYIAFDKFDDSDVIRVAKSKEKYNQDDANTYAKINGVSFHNGTIRVNVLSKLLADAPAHARGFIGLAFRINEDDSEFESLYIRPTNGRVDDPVRKNRALQYFSYPNYTFAYFRDHGITDYEGQADIGLDEWIALKAVIKDEQADLYVNDKLVLHVPEMIHGKDARGSVGLFVDIGTDGFFKDLEIEFDD